MTSPNLDALPGIPVDQDGPVFKEPWEARAFALAVRLQEQGLFSWHEWADELGRTIAQAQASGDPDTGDTYYRHWLNCLESLTMAKGLADQAVLAEQKQAAHGAHQRLHAQDHDHDH